jgi:hypothetical protein
MKATKGYADVVVDATQEIPAVAAAVLEGIRSRSRPAQAAGK